MRMTDIYARLCAALAAVLLFAVTFSVPAFATGGENEPYYTATPVPEITPVPEPTEKPVTGGMEPEGQPLTPEGNATLVDDYYGDIIENNTSSYMLSKVVSDNLMLCKIESNNCFDLFYTGKKLRGHSLYWIQVKIINDNNSCILQLQKKLRTDMKYMYYYIPMVFWLIGILLLFKSVFLMVFIEIMQIAISTIILLILKNVGTHPK